MSFPIFSGDNMNGFIFLLYIVQILSAQLCAADNSVSSLETLLPDTNTTEASSLISNESTPTVKVPSSTPGSSPSHVQQSTTAATTTTTSTSTSTATDAKNIFGLEFFQTECLRCLIVTAGLILACTILLISTLILACKVCQLSRHLKMLNSNIDLISTSEYKVGTAKKDKDKCEPEVNETSMLMADTSQTQEDVGNGITKEEEGKVNEDKQLGEENKKEVGGTANNGEASTGENKKEAAVTTAENPSISQPQEDTTNSQSIAVPASPLEAGEEPKDVV